MDDKERSSEASFIPIEPPATLPEAVPVFESPEKIVQDLLRTEKEIANESLRIVRAGYERERAQWEKIFADKERQLLDLGRQLSEAEERGKVLQEQSAEERARQLEELHVTMQEMEAKRRGDAKKWEMIADEVKSFQESSAAAQSRLFEEQARTNVLKRRIAELERTGKEGLYEKDEEILKLKEQLSAREESALLMQGRKDDEIHLLKEQLAHLQQTLQQERQYQGKVVDKKDSDLDGLQKALQDMVIQLNLERQKLEAKTEQVSEEKKKVQGLEDELRKTVQASEQERERLLTSFRQEQESWEKFKVEFVAKESALHQEAEEHVQRILKSVAILEQQLADEQLRRKESEEKLLQKGLEIQGLVSQKEGLIQEWKKILTAERETWQKQQEEIMAEFERIKQARENEFGTLRQELNDLHAALAEENRLFALERETNKQISQKAQQLDDDRQKMLNHFESREKEWQAALMGDQELFKKQMEESRVKYETQIQSRDLEIYRLDEDLNLLNGQVLELRQKLALEKNENNSRLDRMQDMETRMKSFTARYNQERVEWQEKLQYIQEQGEKQRASMQQYQAEIEKMYKDDLKSYQGKVKAQQGEISQLKQTSISGGTASQNVTASPSNSVEQQGSQGVEEKHNAGA